ncbi:MAG TPA: DUF4199 family protein [Bacteroidota bacterium]|nr:DUF4199 family protein [Bacteroidota bacterium]
MRLQTIFRYGIFASLALILCWMLEYFAGFHTKTIGYDIYTECISSIFFFAIILLGIKKNRLADPTYATSVRTGLLITCCAAVLFALFMTGYLKFINPAFSDNQIAHERDQLIQEGVPDDILIQKVNALRLEYGNGALLIRTFFRTLLEGSAGTFLALAFFRPKKTPGKQTSSHPV